MTLNELYDIAVDNDINVFHYPLGSLKSVSVPYNIGIDFKRVNTLAGEKTHLAHELGHCMTGAFYSDMSFETRKRMENKADKWAFRNIIPCTEIKKALAKGVKELWELADYFDTEVSFVKKAVDYYISQNLFEEV